LSILFLQPNGPPDSSQDCDVGDKRFPDSPERYYSETLGKCIYTEHFNGRISPIENEAECLIAAEFLGAPSGSYIYVVDPRYGEPPIMVCIPDPNWP
jgi:hypothetical protein